MRSMFAACFLGLATLAISPASFAGVYKIVGPDGKITYSDKPPADAAVTEKMDVIRTPTETMTPPAQPAPASSTGSNRATKQPIRETGTTKALPPLPGQPAPALDLATEKAVVGVLGYEDLVKQTENLCVQALPTSMNRYSQAAEAWQARNSPLVAKAQAALSLASGAQRSQINATIRTYNTNSLSAVVKAPTASKIKWCDSSLDSIKDGVMDVRNKPNFTGPLSKF